MSDQAEAPSEWPIVRDTLAEGLRASATFYRWGQALFGGLALGCGAIAGARGLWWLVGFSLVVFGGLAGLATMVAGRARRHPVRAAMFEARNRISFIQYNRTSSSSGALPSHWLAFAIDVKSGGVGVRLRPAQVLTLAPLLPRCYPNAKVTIPDSLDDA